jgi:AraC-like DNA-binding protein
MQDWLFASGSCQWAHDFGRRERVEFARGPVQAFMEQKEVFPGILMFRAGADGRSAFRIAMDGTSSDGQIVLGAMLGGAGTVAMEGAEQQDWREDGRFYALTPIERRVSYDVWARRDWQAVALRLEESALELLGGGGALPDVVRESLAGKRSDMAMTAPLSGAIRTVAHALLRPIYDGATGHIHRQGKVLELLAHQFDLLGMEWQDGRDISSLERRNVREARERLLADLRDPPDLSGLAAAVGMTPRRLNRSFRALYGTTVFDYLRDARLDAARQALEDGSTLPLKQLAWVLGYSQASNFVTAFRRRFGVSPGAYRRVRESEE